MPPIFLQAFRMLNSYHLPSSRISYDNNYLDLMK